MKLLICPDCGKLIAPRFSIHHCKREPAKPTGRRYNSVAALMKGERIPKAIQRKVNRK